MYGRMDGCICMYASQADAVSALGTLSQHRMFFVDLMMAMELCLLKPNESAIAIGMWLRAFVHAYAFLNVDPASTVGYLSVGPMAQLLLFCDLSVREKAWRSRKRGA